jgi:RimJ/RimL family protein N-acetyltransferase
MTSHTTKRLIIRHVCESDHEFFLTLLNEESFIKNIGDKGVRNKCDAINYLSEGPIASYEEHGFGLNIVCLQGSYTPIGMCGLLKRADFDYADLGYAFLPEYCGQGFAQEASLAVLKDGAENHHLEMVLAVTLPSNTSSNHLLKKLGFLFKEEVQFSNTVNNLYEVNLNTVL